MKTLEKFNCRITAVISHQRVGDEGPMTSMLIGSSWGLIPK